MREKEHPTGRLPDVDKSWEDFQKYYNTPEGDGLSLYPSECQNDSGTAYQEYVFNFIDNSASVSTMQASDQISAYSSSHFFQFIFLSCFYRLICSA